MQAYEFKTVVNNGLIQIPERLSDKNLSQVRVILLAETVKNLSVPRKNKFTAMRLKTKGLTFSREEANER